MYLMLFPLLHWLTVTLDVFKLNRGQKVYTNYAD